MWSAAIGFVHKIKLFKVTTHLTFEIYKKKKKKKFTLTQGYEIQYMVCRMKMFLLDFIFR